MIMRVMKLAEVETVCKFYMYQQFDITDITLINEINDSLNQISENRVFIKQGTMSTGSAI